MRLEITNLRSKQAFLDDRLVLLCWNRREQSSLVLLSDGGERKTAPQLNDGLLHISCSTVYNIQLNDEMLCAWYCLLPLFYFAAGLVIHVQTPD